MESELQGLKVDNDHFREKTKDLERWLILLLNNFYDGNPNSQRNIE